MTPRIRKKLKPMLKDGPDVYCPICGTNFGKDTENSKTIDCGHCGENHTKSQRK